eukprot:TRINITY_DN7939_c0_g3_i1.p1 TRINITY_DN7939_c0_g3~~TRINITY_DN7939_c0_g3_i1.p1  ORF type:complete len:335 (+),score=111.37 TRINITY_DN7939_c0_g3_i1:932-1936(+)
MFSHLLKTLVFLLAVCTARRHLQEQTCENGTPVYTLYAIDGTVAPEKAGCTYSLTLTSGSCVLLIHDAKGNSSGHICFDAASSTCKDVNNEALGGSISSDCAGVIETEPIQEIHNFELNKPISIETNILKGNVAVGFGCEGEKPVEMWKPEECKLEQAEEKKEDENKQEENKQEEEKKEEQDKKEEDKKETEEKNVTEEKNNTEPESNNTQQENNNTEQQDTNNTTEHQDNNTEQENNKTEVKPAEPEVKPVEPIETEKNVSEPEVNTTEHENNSSEPVQNKTENNNTTETDADASEQNKNDGKQTADAESNKSYGAKLGMGVATVLLSAFLWI